jgi:hypothetical protein
MIEPTDNGEQAALHHEYVEATEECCHCGRRAPNCTCESTWGLHCFFHNSVEVCPNRTSPAARGEA